MEWVVGITHEGAQGPVVQPGVLTRAAVFLRRASRFDSLKPDICLPVRVHCHVVGFRSSGMVQVKVQVG